MLKTGEIRSALWGRLLSCSRLSTSVLPILAVVGTGIGIAAAPPVMAQQSGADRHSRTSSEAPPAMLVADRVFVGADQKLVAQGNVEAFQNGVRLQATRIEYDQRGGTLSIIGPIRMERDGAVTVLADAAELDNGLRDGILRGARLVFNQQLQLSALQMSRVEGRYSQLYKTSVTSCDVCTDGRPPLWQIRAERITHDEDAQQLYFENAQLRIRNVPVFYFPALRLPDPNLDRSNGFLVPSLTTSSELGVGVMVPYFFTLGDSRDLTVTPYWTAHTSTLGLRYRQAFRTGQMTLTGAFSRDDIQPNDGRGYVFATGQFALGRGFELRFDLKTVSDDGYLGDYNISEDDRLRSTVEVLRARRDQLIRISANSYKTLREQEDQSFVPSTVTTGTFEQRLFPRILGGELRLQAQALQFIRDSGLDATATDANGRDVTQLTTNVTWQRNWILPAAVQANWTVGLGLDSFTLADDIAFANETFLVTPETALTFRRPMSRRTQSGATQYIEPILQLAWSDVQGNAVPNESSTISEFDQGNLLALSRFPGNDARENGRRLTYGINATHIAAAGWQASGTLGQVLRQDADDTFTPSSGLDGTSSNLLVAGQLRLLNSFNMTLRGLLDEEWSVSKAEFRGQWNRDRVNLSGSYLWLQADAREDRAEETSELWIDGTYRINQTWATAANIRYDILDRRATRAGLGLTYFNECVTLDLSVSRRYTSTTSVEPTTDFGFTLALNGFSVKSGDKTSRRSCSKT